MNVDDYLDFEHPADASAETVYQTLRKDSRTPSIIEAMKASGLDDFDVTVAFRGISRIPSKWQIEKEARHVKEKRRADVAARLRDVLPFVQNDPDLSHLYFGTGSTSVGASEPEPGHKSLAECIQEGIDELEISAAVESGFPDKTAPQRREMTLKRFAIREVSALIAIEGKRAPNQLTADIVSVLIDEHVTPNAVSNARKDIRRRNYRDK